MRRFISILINPIINLVADALSGILNNVVASAIEKIGSSLPATIKLGGAFDGVVIPMNLTQNPTMGNGEVRFDFVCG